MYGISGAYGGERTARLISLFREVIVREDLASRLREFLDREEVGTLIIAAMMIALILLLPHL